MYYILNKRENETGKVRYSEKGGVIVYDLAIIGGGPAGYSAALEAAGRNMRVVLFEYRQLGGTCLNRGCVPTKYL